MLKDLRIFSLFMVATFLSACGASSTVKQPEWSQKLTETVSADVPGMVTTGLGNHFGIATNRDDGPATILLIGPEGDLQNTFRHDINLRGFNEETVLLSAVDRAVLIASNSVLAIDNQGNVITSIRWYDALAAGEPDRNTSARFLGHSDRGYCVEWSPEYQVVDIYCLDADNHVLWQDRFAPVVSEADRVKAEGVQDKVGNLYTWRYADNIKNLKAYSEQGALLWETSDQQISLPFLDHGAVIEDQLIITGRDYGEEENEAYIYHMDVTSGAILHQFQPQDALLAFEIMSYDSSSYILLAENFTIDGKTLMRIGLDGEVLWRNDYPNSKRTILQPETQNPLRVDADGNIVLLRNQLSYDFSVAPVGMRTTNRNTLTKLDGNGRELQRDLLGLWSFIQFPGSGEFTITEEGFVPEEFVLTEDGYVVVGMEAKDIESNPNSETVAVLKRYRW